MENKGNKIIYIKHKEIEGVNKTVIDMIADMDANSFLDTVRLLRMRYGIQYKFISDITGINYCSLSNALSKGNFDNLIAFKTVNRGIERMREHFLKDVEVITAGV